MKGRESEASLLLWDQLKELNTFVFLWKWKEYPFSVTRKFRFDFAIVNAEHKLGLEIEGAAWISGRHNRGAGFIKDMEKYNLAALHGWTVLRFTPQQVLNGEAISFIKRVLDT